ncbi:MAG: thiamine diphosphokinase [Alphaproteobacteria bacterium]
MIISKHLGEYRSIICLNGELPNKSFFSKNIPIIAADGAANKLHKMDVIPSVIIGDLDSVDKKIFNNVKKVKILNQDKNDFQKALVYADNNDLMPSIILGASGGFLDHILNNISIIIENNCIFYSPPLIGKIIKSPKVEQLELEPSIKISLFGIPEAIVNTSGLKWELNNAKLTFPGLNSSLNRVVSNNVIIEVSKGILLVLYYETKEIDKGIQ